jgi:hypothetical protein
MPAARASELRLTGLDQLGGGKAVAIAAMDERACVAISGKPERVGMGAGEIADAE